MKKIRAFTLIELLIVVAIIAILAAIAVPNFLEASTRARVSRCKSDMRSVAIACEAYRTDGNRYINGWWPNEEFEPPHLHKWWIYVVWSGAAGSFCGGRQLTTPVAYITTIPLDVFQMQKKNLWGRDVILLASFWYNGNSKENPFPFYDAVGTDWYKPDVGYYFQSCGPDLGFAGYQDDGFVYDPTNGTVSGGDIWYLGKGIGFLGGGGK